jgi:ATP-dependent RNA helicase RhlE
MGRFFCTMKFDGYPFSKELKSQLAKLNFNRPTDIQFKTIPYILDGEDVMAIAQTGTGKTGAFAIPLIELISRQRKSKDNPLSALIMVPTRELAKQITEVIQEISKETKVTCFGIYGGVEQESQINRLGKKLDILVATPGRMFDLISQGHIDVSKVRYLVLDEADLMLAKGFSQDIEDILRKIPQRRQTLFFTATIDKQIKKLAYDVVRNAIRIQISPDNPVAKNILHAVAFMDMDHKRFFLENVLKNYPDERVLVFVRTKVRAERVVAAMERVGVTADFLHGGLEQKDRFLLLDKFRTGEVKVLVTTDVAARGIDIPTVKYVVNYDIPDNPENYVHRCGRCGRGNTVGHALSFCADDEKQLLEDIEKYTGEEIEHYDIDKSEYQQIMFDTEDVSWDWQKLISKDNKENGTEDEW